MKNGRLNYITGDSDNRGAFSLSTIADDISIFEEMLATASKEVKSNFWRFSEINGA